MMPLRNRKLKSLRPDRRMNDCATIWREDSMPALSLEEVYQRYVKPLTPADRKRLIKMTDSDLRKNNTQCRRRWADIAGSAPYPLAGEDAQTWVSRSRQEDDELTSAQR